jgi:hypothetical protein
MNDTYLMILSALVLCGILVWLLVPRKKSLERTTPSLSVAGIDALPSAKHYAYFPQIRQALSAADAEYLRENAPAKVARKALRERRAIARRFLTGLNEDFSALARLGRTIAALSPEVSHKQETERLLLSLRFRAIYALVWLRLSWGALPVHQLEVLAGVVGRLAVRVDEAMTEISALSTRQLTGKLST